MAEKRALIDSNTGKVLNLILYDAAAAWQPPEGTELLPAVNSAPASAGDTWDGNKLTRLISPAPTNWTQRWLNEVAIYLAAANTDAKVASLYNLVSILAQRMGFVPEDK